MKPEMLYDRSSLAHYQYPATEQPIAFGDPKIAFVTERCVGKRVLDLGCAMHHPSAMNSPYFLHRAIRAVSATLVGLDLDAESARSMRQRGYDVRIGDVE